MTRKRKTPPPPRPVQAPKRRSQPSTGAVSRRGNLVAAAALAAIVVGGVAIAVAANPGGGGSFPATSGPHYFEPAVWGFYDAAIDQVRAVHNLEHGGIVVQWGSRVPSPTVEELRAFWRDTPNAMLMAPLPKLGNKIALTAWTHLATCTRFDQDAFAAFRRLPWQGPGAIPGQPARAGHLSASPAARSARVR